MRAVVVLTTVSDRAAARRLSGALVRERLAACVSMVPGVRSVYRWKGRVESAGETLLIVKTQPKLLKPLERFFKARHPYELPEFLVLPASGLKKYLDWIVSGSNEKKIR